MAHTTEWTYIEDKAFDYAEAFRAAGFRTSVVCVPGGGVSIVTTPCLQGVFALGLALSESFAGLEGRC